MGHLDQAIASGELATVTKTVEQVTGRRPQSFADSLAADPHLWSHLARTDRSWPARVALSGAGWTTRSPDSPHRSR